MIDFSVTVAMYLKGSTLFVLLLSLVEGVPPQLFCSKSFVDRECQVENVNIAESRYTITSRHFTNENTTSVSIVSLRLATVSQDFCETFPQLLEFHADNVGVEIIDQNAFASCYAIERIDMRWNRIQVLPPKMFQRTLKLSYVDLSDNWIWGIADKQFETNARLKNLYLEMNRLGAFPVSAIRNSHDLEYLAIHSNNIIDLDAVEIVEVAPKLKEIGINGLLMACSKIERAFETFNEAKIHVNDFYNRTEFPFEMSRFEGLTCILGQ